MSAKRSLGHKSPEKYSARPHIPGSLDKVDFDDPKVIAAIRKAAEDFDEDKYRDRLEQFETRFEGDGGVIWP